MPRGFTTLALSCVLFAGCGSPYGDPVVVTGAATLDGKPLENAGVTFHSVAGGLPAELRTRTGKTDGKGNFRFGEVYPGSYQVSFFMLDDPSKQKLGPDGEPIVLASPNLGPLNGYQAEKTTLSANVSADSTQFGFALESPKMRNTR